MKRVVTFAVAILFIITLLIFHLTLSGKNRVVIAEKSSSPTTLSEITISAEREKPVETDLEVLSGAASQLFVSPASQLVPEAISDPSVINPGCKAKTLHKYKAVDVGRVYHYPSIVHYAKLGHAVMHFSFREFTSVLSVHKFLKPKRIMFHTYTGFSGKYWDEINSLKDVEIVVNKLAQVTSIGGKSVTWIQHKADYVKLSMVYQYGGTALDFDVILINGTRLKREQSLSECVLAEETDYINGGFYSCVKNATFMAKWLEGYHKDYRPDLWLHNVSYRPLSLLTDKDRQECYNVHLDDTICLFPSWSVKEEWLKRGGVKWRTKTAAHYFVKNGIPNDGEGLLKEKFSLAELIQYVHKA